MAPHSLYLLLMSGIPTHPIRAASALGQPKLRNSRCFLMEEKRNILEPREREREWETDGKRANDRIEQGKLDSAPFLRTISCIDCFCLNGSHYGEQSVHTNACHTTVFYSTLSWRVSCLLLSGWFTAKIKQSKSLIHPIFSLSSPFVLQLLVTAYCNTALVVLYLVMSAPPTRNAQYLCSKRNAFTYVLRQGISNTGALLHFKEKLIF